MSSPFQGIDTARTALIAFQRDFADAHTLLSPASSSTVLDLAFANVQWCQTLTLLPVEEPGKFVACQS